MHYCPNCSAYQHDDAQNCPKCGFDIKSYRIEQNRKQNEQKEAPRKEDIGFDRSKPCRICGAPTKRLQEEVQVTVEGKRINIYGVKLMGGEITKPTAVRIEYEITGRKCSEGHLFYEDDVGFRKKPICPLCYDPMMIYGSSLFSCSRCKKHFPMGDWPDPDPEESLKNEGWEHL